MSQSEKSSILSKSEHNDPENVEIQALNESHHNENSSNAESAKEEISKPEAYEQIEQEQQKTSEHNDTNIMDAYQNILDIKQDVSASEDKKEQENVEKSQSHHESENKANAYNFINQQLTNNDVPQQEDHSEQPKSSHTPVSEHKSPLSSKKSEAQDKQSSHDNQEEKDSISHHDSNPIENKNSFQSENKSDHADSVQDQPQTLEAIIEPEQLEQQEKPSLDTYQVIQTTITQKITNQVIDAAPVEQDSIHSDAKQPEIQENVEQIIETQEHEHKNTIDRITRPDMTQEDLQGPSGQQTTEEGRTLHQTSYLSPGVSYPPLPGRNPEQPRHVQNTLEFNDERIFSRFDFDPQNPENIDPIIVLDKGVVQLRLNAPARELLTQGLSGTEQQQLHALEEQYIRQLRIELLEDKATAERLRIERELFDKTLARQQFIHNRSGAATERLKRININRSTAHALQSEYERTLRQKIARDDEKAEFLRQTRKFNEIQAQLNRYKDDEERQIQLGTFRDVLALEKELKLQRLEGKYERESELLSRQKAARRERAEQIVNQAKEQRKRARDAFEQRKQAERANLEAQLEKYNNRSQIQQLNRSKSLNMTTLRAFSTNNHITEVKDRGVALRNEKLEKHKQQVIDNETRAAVNIQRLKQLREKNVQERRELHDICLQRSKQVREIEDQQRERKEIERIKKENEEVARKEMEKRAMEDKQKADQEVRRICGHFQFLNADGRFAVGEDGNIGALIPQNSILRLPRNQAKQLVADHEERRAKSVFVMHNTNAQMQHRSEAEKDRQNAYQVRGRGARAHYANIQAVAKNNLTGSQQPTGLSRANPQIPAESRAQLQAQLLQLMAFNRAREEERKKLLDRVSSTEAQERLGRLFEEERRVYQQRLGELQKRYEMAQ